MSIQYTNCFYQIRKSCRLNFSISWTLNLKTQTEKWKTEYKTDYRNQNYTQTLKKKKNQFTAEIWAAVNNNNNNNTSYSVPDLNGQNRFKAQAEEGGGKSKHLFIYLLKAYSPVNRTRSALGFSQVQIATSQIQYKPYILHKHKTYKHNPKVSPFDTALVKKKKAK